MAAPEARCDLLGGRTEARENRRHGERARTRDRAQSKPSREPEKQHYACAAKVRRLDLAASWSGRTKSGAASPGSGHASDPSLSAQPHDAIRRLTSSSRKGPSVVANVLVRCS